MCPVWLSMFILFHLLKTFYQLTFKDAGLIAERNQNEYEKNKAKARKANIQFPTPIPTGFSATSQTTFSFVGVCILSTENHIFCFCSAKRPQFFCAPSHVQGANCHAGIKVFSFLPLHMVPVVLYFRILFYGPFLLLICPRQRRKSSQEVVDMEGLQAGLEKLAMKPKVVGMGLISRICTVSW